MARRLFLVAVTTGIVLLTLGPATPPPEMTSGPCCLTPDLVLNIMLFVPFGIALGLVRRRVPIAVAIGALLSTAIEILQLWIPGRDSAISDVAANSLGTLFGALVVWGWPARHRWWKIPGLAVAAIVVGASVTASFLVRPALPSPAVWWGQWAHDFYRTLPFEGQVLGFNLQGIPIGDGRVGQGEHLNAGLAQRDTIRLEARIISGPPVPGRAQLIGLVADGPGGEYVNLWQEGRSLRTFVRLRLNDAGLRSPWLRLRDALPGSAGDTVEISATVTRRQVLLSAHHPGGSMQRAFDLSAATFWGAFFPSEFDFGSRVPSRSLIPITLSFGGLGAGIRSRIAMVLASLVALLAGPVLAGTAFPAAVSLAAAVFGVGAGRWIAFRLGLLR